MNDYLEGKPEPARAHRCSPEPRLQILLITEVERTPLICRVPKSVVRILRVVRVSGRRSDARGLAPLGAGVRLILTADYCMPII